jgi:hypothetical protein
MPRYFVNVQVKFANNTPGPGFNFELEADGFVDALERGKAVVTQALKDSGLQEIAVAPAPPATPAEPPPA